MLVLTTRPDSMDSTVAAARGLLVKPSAKDATLAALAAAALCAVCAVALAVSVIFGPPGQAKAHATAPAIGSDF